MIRRVSRTCRCPASTGIPRPNWRTCSWRARGYAPSCQRMTACRSPASRNWPSAGLAVLDHSAARWIEDAVPDSERAIRVGVVSDDDAAAKVVEALNSPAFRADDKKAMVSAFLCRAYNVAASVEAD